MSARLYLKSSEGMSEVEDESVSLILTTPPEWRAELHYIKSPLHEDLIRWMMVDIPSSIIKECYRVLKSGGFLIYNIGTPVLTDIEKPLDFEDPEATRIRTFLRTFYHLINAASIFNFAPFYVVGDLIGIYPEDRGKIEGTPEEIERQFVCCSEHYFVFAKGKWKLKHPFGNVIFQNLTNRYSDLQVCKALVLGFSDEGDLVLDPFAGTGTTGLAALETGRNAVMYDIDPDIVPKMKAKIPSVEVFS